MLPFFAFGVVWLGGASTGQALILSAAGVAAGAAILVGEWLWVKGAPTFTSSLAFITACGLTGLGLTWLPSTTFLGFALALLALAGVGLAREAQG
jgi:hypothetical protein